MFNTQKWFRKYFVPTPSEKTNLLYEEDVVNYDNLSDIVHDEYVSEIIDEDSDDDSIGDNIINKRVKIEDTRKRKRKSIPVVYHLSDSEDEQGEKEVYFGENGIFGYDPSYDTDDFSNKDKCCSSYDKSILKFVTTKVPSYIPIIKWLPRYKFKSLNIVYDFFAALSVAVLLIPQGMAYALLAGMPPQYGLYTAWIPLFIYTIFGNSKQMIVGPDALICILVYGTLKEQVPEGPGSTQWIESAIILALMVGVITLLLGIFRFGFLDNIFSLPIIRGFISAVSIIIMISQVENFLGIPPSNESDTIPKIEYIFKNMSSLDVISFSYGLVSLICLVCFTAVRKRFPNSYVKFVPMVLIIVVISLLSVSLTGIKDDIATMQEIKNGIPRIGIPELTTLKYEDIIQLIAPAMYISIIGFIESIVIAKEFASIFKYPIYSNQELLALGVCNIFGSFFSSFPTYGGLGRTQVAAMTGAKSQLTSLFTSGIILFVMTLLVEFFKYLPSSIPAAIVLEAAYSLLSLSDIFLLWKIRAYLDILILLISFFTTIFLGTELGMLISIGLSILLVIKHTSEPNISILGNIPNTDKYKDISLYSQATTMPGVLIIRIEEAIYFANIGQIKLLFSHFERLKLMESKENKNDSDGDDNNRKRTGSLLGCPLNAIIIDAKNIPEIDASATKVLKEMIIDWKKRKIQVYFVKLRDEIKERLIRSGIIDILGSDHFCSNTKEVVNIIRGDNIVSWSTYRDIDL